MGTVAKSVGKIVLGQSSPAYLVFREREFQGWLDG